MSRRYFQFHLCALGFGANEWQRLDAIINYGCVEMGRRLWNECSVDYRDALRKTPPAWCRSNPRSDAQLQALLGCQHLNIMTGDLGAMVAGHSTLVRFIKDFEQRHGPDARLRIVTTWVFEARDRKGISYPELAVLAAVYSKVGAAKGPVRITRNEIWRRALGFKSERVFRAEGGSHEPAITRRQVRSIIERLQDRKFFSRITYGRRQTYYSHRLTAAQLEEKVFIKKTLPDHARHTRIAANARLTKRVQEERRRLASPDAGSDAAAPAT